MGLDYNYSQPSQDETFGGAETDSEYNEVESLIQQDQAQLHEALIHQQEALIQQDQAHAFVYPPQPEVEFGFPQICYCGSEPKIARSSIEPGRRYYTCRNANDGECHVWKWWDEVVMEEMRARDRHTLQLAEKVNSMTFFNDQATEQKLVRLENMVCETTARKCLHHFTNAIIHLFGDEYLRYPTPEDLQRLLYIGEQRGFPGMVGSIDCMHWEWKNCPAAWKEMYSQGTGKPTIVLEAVADYDLWIWHAFFGAPAPHVNFYVNGHPYYLAYYLTDGIYPDWATFIQSIHLPQSEKHSLFSKTQEAVRKDVERAFGVLQARFPVVRNPSNLWDKHKIGNIMRACIILHNMIVEDERAERTQYVVPGFDESKEQKFSVNMLSPLGNTIDRRTNVRNRQAHRNLKNDLIENKWTKFGHLSNNM
uniref:Zinc finger GRF-type domain-containing protein n=1 Tax=Brassica oleracea var. oleracea TaxID=109376 RepID=A0A0D3BKW9_BRAOL